MVLDPVCTGVVWRVFVGASCNILVDGSRSLAPPCSVSALS